MDKMIIESFIRDDMTNQPIDNVYISVDAIKSSQGMGDFISGRREDAGEAKTNSQGYYKLTLRVFKMLKDLNSELMRGMKELD